MPTPFTTFEECFNLKIVGKRKGTSEDYNEICLPLYKASITILGKCPELVRFSITESYETVLHIAVLGESLASVEFLVSIMSKDDLEIPNIKGETALHKAAITGNIEIARILLVKNKNLLHIPDRDGKMPIYKAAVCRKRDMVDLLYMESQQMTSESWTNEDRGLLYVKCVEADLFDVALRIVTEHPILATEGSVLGLLARKPHGFYVISPGIIQECLNSYFRVCRLKIRFPDKESDSLKLLGFTLEEIGNLPKVERDEIIRGPPDEIISSRDSILAVEDKNGDNMLHLVGQKTKGNKVQNIRGVGLRLNPEIYWFKEIETIIPPHLRERKNAAGLTPHNVFIKNHKDLFSKCEDWMKEIATQLMVVAALVATTSYSVVFQLPSGYTSNNNDPNLRPKNLNILLFRLFFIFDSLSFMFSTTSILMVLSILGSNYDEYDFMLSLSKQLDICLGFVFASIVTMVLTFLINCFLIFNNGYIIGLPIIISIFAITPFAIFVISKYHLPSRIMRGFRMLYESNKSAKNLHLD